MIMIIIYLLPLETMFIINSIPPPPRFACVLILTTRNCFIISSTQSLKIFHIKKHFCSFFLFFVHSHLVSMLSRSPLQSQPNHHLKFVLSSPRINGKQIKIFLCVRKARGGKRTLRRKIVITFN